MAGYYFDRSALVERYVQEVDSHWVLEITRMEAGHDVFIAKVTGPETGSALNRKVHTGEVTQEQGLQVIENFKNDFWGQYDQLDVTEEVVTRAMTLAQRYNLRGYDSIQLAAAVELQVRRGRSGLNPLTFLSADNSLNAAATLEGLVVDNPNIHA